MAHTMAQVQADTEIWLNTAPGTRWYRALDLYGRETTKTVRGGKTFTLTTFERQLNQENVANPEQDLFRNGTFVLRKPSENTIEEEVRSPNSLTEMEIEGLVTELTYGDNDPKDVLREISSDVTMSRLYEALVAEGAPKKITDFAKKRMAELKPAPSSGGKRDSQPVMTTPEEDEFDAIKTEPVVADSKDDNAGGSGGRKS